MYLCKYTSGIPPMGGGNTRGTDSSPWTKNLAYLPSLFSLYPSTIYTQKTAKMSADQITCRQICIYIYIIYMLGHIYYIYLYLYIYIYIHYIYYKNSAQKDAISVCHGRRIALWFWRTKLWFVIIFSSYSGLFQSLK